MYIKMVCLINGGDFVEYRGKKWWAETCYTDNRGIRPIFRKSPVEKWTGLVTENVINTMDAVSLPFSEHLTAASSACVQLSKVPVVDLT